MKTLDDYRRWLVKQGAELAKSDPDATIADTATRRTVREARQHALSLHLGASAKLAEIDSGAPDVGRRILAEILQSLPAAAPAAPDAMLSLADAAKLLGYQPSGLRKIVARTKKGMPGIRFTQIGRGPIKFKREWLNEFTTSNLKTPRPQFKAKHLR